ncbi:MAG: type III pantothenate kinase [Saprospiraceae bacterium]|jgi:type III pantothenate kinase|nr:type III pantothenate kinase [Saprospiraceae bacterium]MBP9210256.1 type III pantothenate kinase [Saprospiraceae bacterium]MBV6473772.1 Type III pantothenate kinase [Saprospiraceae bacterium]
MSERLCIDLGNSRIKLAQVRKGLIQDFAGFRYDDQPLVKRWFAAQSVYSGIYCSVLESEPEWLLALFDRHRILRLDTHWNLPIRIDQYQTPQTLGSDRVAALAGARQAIRSHPILVVNAGTCVTFDLLSAEGEFLGGNISPGLELRWRSMHAFTSRLPMVHAIPAEGRILGLSTQEALERGGFQGLVFEISAYYSAVCEKYPDAKCVLTGGSTHQLVNRLKFDIFADPYLVLKGLNYISEYNELQ